MLLLKKPEIAVQSIIVKRITLAGQKYSGCGVSSETQLPDIKPNSYHGTYIRW